MSIINCIMNTKTDHIETDDWYFPEQLKDIFITIVV